MAEMTGAAHFTKEEIIRIVKEENIRFVRLQFTDIFGQCKNVAITESQLEKALSNKCMFDGSSIEGFARIEESDIETVKEHVESVFNEEQKNVLESVWITYGEYSADELERLTHSEKPWLEQREDLGKFESSHRVISEETMKDYYQSIAIPS